MAFVSVEHRDEIATVTLARGKVNAINPAVVEELSSALISLRDDASARALILTGHGKFFSFGFDIPEFLSYSRESFAEFLTSFTTLLGQLFTYPKPVVVAINGHAIAGGCMLALTADTAIMADGPVKIALNEVGFGASVFAGCAEMLTFRIGRHATEVLYSGTMYSAADAQRLGLVHEVVASPLLPGRAHEIAREIGAKRPEAFSSIKALLRGPIAASIAQRDGASIREFVEIWYSEPTWTNLRAITIR